MIRHLKTLGLALTAVLALSALAASAASAQQGKLTSTGPVTATGTETGGLLANAFTTPLGNITCGPIPFTGHTVVTHAETTAGSKHGLLPSGSTTSTITPHISPNCVLHIPIVGTRPVTGTMNGCDFVFHLGSTTGGANTYGVTADVVCPPSKKIEFHVYKSGSVTHPEADAICTVKVGEENNQGIAGLHQSNTGSDDLELTGAFENVHMENTGTLCGTGTSETADLDVDVTVKGHNSNGEETGITLSD
ncbi:MAG: hypothetical protein WA687_11305 [Solirubrobacterales bacterium]